MAKKFHVLRDTREKKQGGWVFQENKYCSGTSILKLDSGDYTIQGLENKLCIERKATVKEFATNCIEKRFIDNLYRMKKFPHKFIIFEFDYWHIINFPQGSGIPKARADKMTKINAKYMMTFTGTILTKFGIPIIYAGDTQNAGIAAFNIMKQTAGLYEDLL